MNFTTERVVLRADADVGPNFFEVEVKGGVFDSPNLKVGIGYTFR